MDKQIKIKVEGKMALPYGELIPFQNDLKTLDKERYERLRASILKEGICFTKHVWPNEGKYFLIDGHQTIFVVKQMVEAEGFEVGNIPVSIIHADSFREAKRKVLAGASVYGRMTEKSIFDFLNDADLNFEDIAGEFDFPDIDLDDLAGKFFDEEAGSLPPPDLNAPDMPSSSNQVKQIQLLFNAGSHEEFLVKAQALASVYKTENLTDTVMEAIRADHQSKYGKS